MTNTQNNIYGNKNATLTIYKASAGSGKTFTLALEYIKLLIQDAKAYEGILAVTFTNKATEEMKMRILSTLYGLWKGLPSSKNYMEELKKSMHLDEETIAKRSENALRLLLHNYHFFRVQTIDTFFQGVLRNLARELQLNANLRVGLNNSQVVEEAVDGIIDSLADDHQLMNMVKGYMEEKISDDKSWNVIGQIKKFGGTIFEELYKKNRRKMDIIFADPDFFDNFKRSMHEIMQNTSSIYKTRAQEILDMIADSNLSTDDFSNKSRGPIGYFIKLASGQFASDDDKLVNSTLKKALDDSNAWVTKTSKNREFIMQMAEDCLIPAVKALEHTRTKDAVLYRSAKVTLNHLNDVRLLRRIEEEAHNLNDASQRFMLSDTQSLLHEIIEDDDSPFIFEKIGSRLDHVMIDEFQDTSTIQWANFKTLLKECMSRGLSNLIVGDVKQSIYRFRSGDWRLLNDIDKEFSKEELDFQPRLTNWRSKRNVIKFNNAFFQIAAELEANDVARYSEEKADSIRKAYKDVCQEVPEVHNEKVGLVNIKMIPHGELGNMEEYTLQNIVDLMDLGVEQKDIAILMRNKKDIPTMAQYIESHSNGKIRIVSAEAFRLDASADVRIIINAMKLLANPNDKVALASLVKDYNIATKKSEDVGKDIFSTSDNLRNWLPKDFNEHHDELISLTLHDLTEALMRIFSINERDKESAYITTLFDCIHSFTNDMAPMLDDFLEAWESEIATKTIETGKLNGVRILTIHKSKGLEFDHVILPYCNWRGDPPGSTIWASPKEEPFSLLPMVPLDYRTVNSLKGTIYEADGVEEYIQNIVDNLNLLYVAMTRAGHSLFIIGERNRDSFTRSRVICQAIDLLPPQIDDSDVHIDGLEDEESTLEVTFGRLNIKRKEHENKAEKDDDSENNPFDVDPKGIETAVCSHPTNVVIFRQSNDSRRFTEDSLDEKDGERYIKIGTIMHQLFSTIHTLYDVEPALQRMEFDGTLYDNELSKDELLAQLRKKFSNPQVKEWFSDRWKVYNECTIITPQGEQRPDRVITDGKDTIVIDFKFGKFDAEHKEQVGSYMNLLRQMGMPNVKGFLWYVTFDKIENV